MKRDNFIDFAVVAVFVYVVGSIVASLQPTATAVEALAQACVIVAGIWYLISLLSQKGASSKSTSTFRAKKKPEWVKVSGTKPVGDIEVTLVREGSHLPSASHVWARKVRQDGRSNPPVASLVSDSLANAKAAALALHSVDLMADERLELEVLVDVLAELPERIAFAEKVAREEAKARRNANKKGDGQVVQVNGSAHT